MSGSGNEAKRRFSDHARAPNLTISDSTGSSNKRRQTIGDLRRETSRLSPTRLLDSKGVAYDSKIPSINIETPSKKKVLLGSAAAAYFFSGRPQTGGWTPTYTTKTLKPSILSSSSKKKIHSESDKTDGSDFNRRLLASPASSADSYDVLNQSVLSDTTELTASNFVLAATSRQKLMEMRVDLSEKENRRPHNQLSHHGIAATPKRNDKGELAVSTKILSTSPRSLRTLTETLKNSRLQLPGQFLVTPKKATSCEKAQDAFISSDAGFSRLANDLNTQDVSQESIDDLFDGLLSEAQNESEDSQSSLLVTPPKENMSPTDKDRVPPSPSISPNSETTSFFLSSPSKYKSKITPTKLNKSPRRVLNAASIDSPAKRTRSAMKGRCPKKELELVSTGVESCMQAQTTFSLTSDDHSDQPWPLKGMNPPGKNCNDSSDEMNENRESCHAGNHKLSFEQLQISPLQDAGTPLLDQFRHELGTAPKSILNSAKKRRQVSEIMCKKSVAFGSPEAAEYHVGSPSVSITPMPANRAKAMFAIPRAGTEDTVSDTRSNVTFLSKEADTLGDTNSTVAIEASMQELLNGANHSAVIESMRSINSKREGESSLNPPIPTPEATIELETSMNDILQLSMNDCDNLSTRSNPIDSVEFAQVSAFRQTGKRMAEGQASETTKRPREETSLCSTFSESWLTEANVNSTPQNASGIPGVPTKNYKVCQSSERSSSVIHADEMRTIGAESTPGSGRNEEETTVELEADMSAILALSSRGMEQEGALPSIKLSDRFPKICSTFMPPTNRMSFGQSPTEAWSGSEVIDGQSTTLDFGLADSPASTASQSKNRRIHSLARFSLAPSTRLSISSKKNIRRRISSAEDHCSDGVKFTGSVEIEEAAPITYKEVNVLADLESVWSRISQREGFHVVMQLLVKESGSLKPASVMPFAIAVCSEVEGKASLILGSDVSFNDMLDSTRDEEDSIMKWLHLVRSDIRMHAERVGQKVQHEWLSWENKLMDSFIAIIKQIEDESEEECAKLDQCTAILDDLRDGLLIKAGKAARAARRRSLARQQNRRIVLDSEIEILEKESVALQEKKSSLDSELQGASVIKRAAEERVVIDGIFGKLSKNAKECELHFASARGLSRISLAGVDTSSLDLAYTGCSPLSCLKNRISFVHSGSFECHPLVNSSGFPAGEKRETLSRDASLFMTSRLDFIRHVLGDKEARATSDLQNLIRHLDWAVGRVEGTARELTSLQQRFSLCLEKNPNGGLNDFLVRISFETSCKNVAFMATFELTPSYPFGPLHVSVEKEQEQDGIDLCYLQKHLIRSAKPGFGHLSRACDVIQAILKAR